MVMLAMLYLLTQKAALIDIVLMLTLKDALEIMQVVMPKRHLTPEDVVNILREKHENREMLRLTRLKAQEKLLAECKNY